MAEPGQKAPPVNTTPPLAAPKPQPAPASPRPRAAEPAAATFRFPPVDAPDLDAAWDEFFANNTPPVSVVGGHMLKLHGAGHHKQVVAALRAALINGQAQPWMYEALAGSMAIEKFPQEEIERVLLSMTDFGQADFASMLYSAAYLVRFDRLDTALRMYRQASRMQPERPEPYLLSVEHAALFKNPDDVIWAACGVLRYDWTAERATNIQTARSALANLERDLARAGNQPAIDSLRTAVAEAQAIDVEIEVVWSGDSDIDLEVEEPSGTVCSITQPQTAAGGNHLGDGYGPRPQDCREMYVCPSGFAGEYRIRLKHARGNVIGRRATVTMTTHKGTSAESRQTKTVVFEDAQGATSVRLDRGRRELPRTVQENRPAGQPVTRLPGAKSARRDANVVPASGQANPAGAIIGAIGFQPNVQVISEGVTLGASALISPDRRYVRMGISPTFSNITDVFTFSVFGGVPAGGPNSNQGPQSR